MLTLERPLLHSTHLAEIEARERASLLASRLFAVGILVFTIAIAFAIAG